MMYSNNIQSRGGPFQGSPNLLVQSTPPQQQYSPMYGIASPQTRIYTPPERFSTPYSTTFHHGAMQTAPLRMMGNVQGTPPGMMGNVQGTPPGMMRNIQGTPPRMMGNVQGTPPGMMGNVQGTPPGMMGNVQGTPPRMMGNIQGTPPGMMGNIQGTSPGMMGNVQGTPPRMMGNVQGTPPGMMGNIQGTSPGMMGNIQGTPPRMMGNTLPGMMGATPPMHLAQNIGTRFMSPTMQYGNTSPLIHSTVPTQTTPRGSLPSGMSQYGSVSNPTTNNSTQPLGIAFTAMNFIPQAQTKPSIGSVTAGVSIQQPLVGNYRVPLLGNTPTAPLSSTPLFNQTLTLSSTAPPLSTGVPVFCQAPLSTSVPVFGQAPLSTSVPVFCQAPSLLSNAPLLSFPFVSQQQPTFQFGTLSSEKSKFTFSSQSTPLFTPLESSDFSPPSAKQPTAKISSIHRNEDPIGPQQYPFPVTSTPLLATPSVSLAANNTSSTSNNSSSSSSIGYKPFDSSNTVTGYKPFSIAPSLPFTGFNTTSANNTTTSSSLKPLPVSSSSIPSLFMSMPTTSNNTTTTSSVFPPFNLFSLTGATPSLVPNTTSTTSFSLLKQPNSTITVTSFPSFQPVSLHSSTSPPASPDTSNGNVKSPDVSFEFQPIVSLPEIIQPKSGEEEETELFSDHAKLYRFDKGQWKERGTGIVKILRNETTSKARIVMRRDQILKICCNHFITQDMELIPYGSTDDRWMWFTLCDYTDGIGKPEKLVIKFHKQPNVAKKFKDVFNETKRPSTQDHSSDGDTTSKHSNIQDNMIITNPSTNWECSECWVSNNKSSTECVACQTSKPGTKPLASGITPSGMGLGIGPSGGFSPGGFKLGTTQLVSSGVSGGLNITGLNLGSLAKPLVGGASSSILMSDSIFKGSNDSQLQISGIKIGTSQEKQDDDNDGGESDEDTIESVTDTDEDSDNGEESVEESSQTNNKHQPLTSQPTIPLTSQASVTIPSQTLTSQPDVSQPLTSQPTIPSLSLTSVTVPSQPFTSQPTIPSLPLTSVTVPSQPLTSQASTTIPSQPNATILSQPLELTVTTTCTSMSFSIAKPSFNFSSSLAPSPFINSNLQSKLSTASSVNNSPFDTTVTSSFADLSKGFQFNPTIIKSNHDDNEDSDDNDTITETSYDDIKVTPLVSLPKVAVSTGEENEKECFNSHAKLYRMVNGEWKERGCGEIKILCNNTNNYCRIIMRRDQTLKLCCNHYLYPYMKLVPHGGEGKNWVWHTKGDLSEDSQKEETLLVRFQSVEVSSSFEECFEKMTSEGKEESETTPTFDDDDVIFVKEELPSDELISKAVSFLLPKSFYNYLNKPSCPGCIGCIEEQDNEHNTHLIEKQQSIMADTAPYNSETTPNNSETTPDNSEITLYNSNTSPNNSGTTPPKSTPTIIPFGKASTGLLSFSELSVKEPVFKQKADSTFSFTGTGQQLFRSPQVGGANDDDYNPEEETTVNFKPLVTLPETYTYQTEEEENNVLFEARGKLYRYDGQSEQWKERGVGNMRLLEYPKSGKYRVLMRRDQIFKICCNHYITPDMRISHHFGNEKALMWSTLCDYSEQVPRPEKLALKFGKAETAKAFMKEFVNCVCMLTQDSPQSMNNDDNDQGEYREESVKNDDNCDLLVPINKEQTPPPNNSNKDNVNNTHSDKGGQVPGKEITEQDVIIDNLSQSSMPELVDNTPNNSQEQ